jgi:hypothetical protein
LAELLVLVLFSFLGNCLGDLLLLHSHVLADPEAHTGLVFFELVDCCLEVVSLFSKELLEVRLHIVLHLLLHHEDVVLEEAELTIDVVKLVDKRVALLIHL